jgi:uncharacterized protein
MADNPITEWPKLQPWVVVGVSQDREKYGNIIYRDLRNAGYKVYGVNPKLDVIEGDPCFHSLRELPEKPAVVDLVVPPQASLSVIEECKELGIERVWFQPGSESDEAIERAESYGIQVVANACIMLQKEPVS